MLDQLPRHPKEGKGIERLVGTYSLRISGRKMFRKGNNPLFETHKETTFSLHALKAIFPATGILFTLGFTSTT
jgi:hypothetical protein